MEAAIVEWALVVTSIRDIGVVKVVRDLDVIVGVLILCVFFAIVECQPHLRVLRDVLVRNLHHQLLRQSLLAHLCFVLCVVVCNLLNEAVVSSLRLGIIDNRDFWVGYFCCATPRGGFIRIPISFRLQFLRNLNAFPFELGCAIF